MGVELRDKVYQLFVLGTEGDGYKTALGKGLGGMIFFAKDILSVEQFKGLINDVKSLAKVKPFLSIDQEGGRVERTENIYGGKKYLSAKFAYEKGLEFLENQTEQIANELKSYGINLNFAPCIDVNTNPENPIIGERAFSSNVEEVIVAENIVSRVYKQNSIIPCVKHFPGHGDANADSHLTLPQIDLSLEEMEQIHIKPFRLSIQKGVEMVMVAHLHCTCFEKDVIPTSLSKVAISYLREVLGFDGVVISDDMVMKGVAHFGQLDACIMALKAGVNLFIYRDSSQGTIDLIDELYEQSLQDTELRLSIEKSYDRVVKLKQKYFL